MRATVAFVAPDPLSTISGRIPAALIPRLDAIAAEMSRRAHGAHLKRSDAIRASIERGVAALEKELGIEATMETKPARKPAAKK